MKSWDSKGLWLKSKLFVDSAKRHADTSPEFAFWSGLALECLARCALTHVHPALNADPREDANLIYAFGFDISRQPRSLPAHSVFLRLEKIIPEFGKEQRELCDYLALLRNQHLHSADIPYEQVKPSAWIARYFEVCKILNDFVGRSMEEYFGAELAGLGNQHISTLGEEVSGEVKRRIEEHIKIFRAMGEQDQAAAQGAAAVATRIGRPNSDSRTCPACGSSGFLGGAPVRELEPTFSDGELLVERQFLATDYECLGCGLVLKGLSQIVHAGIEPHFSISESTSLHELYEAEHFEEYDNM